jgi:hypothetical protein
LTRLFLPGNPDPLFPSTVIICPSLIRRVTLPAPITAGIPYSRATMEPWAKRLPISVTRPLACENNGDQAGVVVGHTNRVPGGIFANSAGERMSVADAVILPALTEKPCRLSCSSLFHDTGIRLAAFFKRDAYQFRRGRIFPDDSS